MHQRKTVTVDDRPQGLSWRSSTTFIITTVIIGLFSETFLYGVVVPILPFVLEERAGIDKEDLQKVSSIVFATYAGSSAISSPIVGAIADRSKERRTPYLVGLIILIAATTIFFTSHSAATLIVARCLQGISSALIWSVGFALCYDTVGVENMGKTLGMVLGFVNVGALLSPPLGGIIYEMGGLYGIAAIAGGLLLSDLVMRFLMVEKKIALEYDDSVIRKLEGIVAEADTEAKLQDEQSPDSEDHEESDEGSVSAIQPMLDDDGDSLEYLLEKPTSRILQKAPILLCFRHPSLITAVALSATQSAILGGFDATVPLEANELFNFTALQAGLLFIPLGALRLAAVPLGGWAVDRYGSKPVAILGFSFLTPILFLFRFIQSEPRDVHIGLYCVLLGLSGIGLAVVGTPSFVETSKVVREYHKRNPVLFGENGPFASLFGINLMAFNSGMTLGSGLAGTLRQRINYGNMNAVLAGLAGFSAIASLIWLGERPTFLKRRS